MTENTILAIGLLDFNKGQLQGLPKNPRFFRDYRYEAMKKSIEESPEMLELRELIVYPLACLHDVHLFGFTSAISPVMYNEWGYYSLSKMITGCAYGVRYNKNVWWNEEIRLKEDFWISCYMKFKERRILTDLRYNFAQKGTFVNAGGLAAFRNQEEERRSILFIKKHFGDSINIKGATNNGKDKTKQLVEYNISCKFKF